MGRSRLMGGTALGPEYNYSQAWVPAFLHFLSIVKIFSKELPEPAPITPYGAQLMFLREVDQGLSEDQHSFSVLKARQLGISTIMLAFDLFWLFWHPGLQGALIADEDKNTQTFRETITMMLESLPPGFRIPVARHNRNALILANGSRLQYLTAGKKKNPDLGRSRGLNFVHASEISSWGDQDGIHSLIDALATENPHRLYIFESTAKGYNAFWDVHNDHASDPTKRAMFIGWWAKELYRIREGTEEFQRWWGVQPELTDQEQAMATLIEQDYGVTIQPAQWAWWRKQTYSRSEQNLLQEFPWHERVAFQVTGSPFFSLKKINEDVGLIQSGAVTFDGYAYELGDRFLTMQCRQVADAAQADLRIYEPPIKGAKYAIGVDVAYGRNPDNDRHCLDPETEILTRRGWLRHDEVQIGDEAVCFDPETGAYAYGEISDKILKPHAGDMVRVESRGVDCLMTPDHRVVGRLARPLSNGSARPWSVFPAGELAEAKTFREIPIGRAPAGSGVEGLSLEMCRALGWVVTDGHVTNNGRRSSITLVQALATEKGGVVIADAMRDGILALAPNATVRDRPAREKSGACRTIRVGVEEAAPILSWLDDSGRIPRRLLTECSPAQLEALFQGVLEGDGGWDSRPRRFVKVCPGKDGALADDIQELAMRLGYCATKAWQKETEVSGGQWVVRLSTRRAHVFTPESVSTETYQGEVWCVTVPTGAFVARRAGKTFVTGNCIQVFRCFADRAVQVAEWATNIPESRHVAWVLAHLAGSYRDCMINLEVSGPGLAVMTEMKLLRQDIEHAQLWEVTPTFDARQALAAARWFLYHRPDTPGQGYMYNWKTNHDNKQEMFNGFRDAYSTDQVIIRSSALLNEMTTLVQNGVAIQASARNKDDRPFSAGLAIHAWRHWIRLGLMQEGRTYEVEMRRQQELAQNGGNMVQGIIPAFFARKARERTQAELQRLIDGV